jgi:alginate O-acetyltransferase complex protein AlgI
MLFNSIQFALFFPIVTLLHFVLPHRWRWALLLAASCLFYMAFIPAYILILTLTIAIDYSAAIWIEKTQGTERKTALILSIVSTCLVLLLFKYLSFADHNLAMLAKLVGWNYSEHILGIVLPIGLSFHTFQSLSYVVEVYRGNQRAERHFGIYSLYVMFYPQLVAGPIERPQNLLHQFREKKSLNYENVAFGLKLMAWGFFKKTVIADRLAPFVNEVYSSPLDFSGATLALATVAFAYQIYCDFSGYSDIAIGAARVMGFRLMRNFDSPYFSQSIGEFWKRWHISLSTWFRDYLYIPLGGNRTSVPILYRNLLITFMVSGLWHGANWTYVVWGALNGFYLVFGHWTAASRNRIHTWSRIRRDSHIALLFRVTLTFVLTCIAWIFFRASSLPDALAILTRIGTEWNTAGRSVQSLTAFDATVLLIAILTLEVVQLGREMAKHRTQMPGLPVYLRWTAYYALIGSVLVFGVFQRSQFIYFQF